MSPPPPRFSKPHLPKRADSVIGDTKKPTVQHLSDTLLKLAEYGDDEEEEILDPSVELPKSSPFGNSTVKPFWAV